MHLSVLLSIVDHLLDLFLSKSSSALDGNALLLSGGLVLIINKIRLFICSYKLRMVVVVDKPWR